MDNPRPKRRRWTLIVFGVLFLLLGYTLFGPQGGDAKDVTYSQFMAEVDAGKVKKATVNEGSRSLVAELSAGGKIAAKYVGEENIAERLRGKGIDVDVKVNESGGAATILLSLLPTLIFIVLIIFGIRWVMRQSGPGGQASLFTSSKAKRIDPKNVDTRFADVLGADEAVEEAREMVAFLKDPAKFGRKGAKVPRGALFVGPPGTGKSLLARAVAGEAGVPFLSTSGSEFVELFVGVGAGRVRSLMEEARKVAPCIVFIDEIDAVGRKRGSGLGNTHDEREQTLNQLLVEIDGFEKSTGVLFIAATNRPDVLDEALLRRFGRTITMPHPDITGRLAILRHYGAKVALAPETDLRAIAALTTGFSGDNLEKLINEAALLAGRDETERDISQQDLENAFERVVLGAPRKLVMSLAEKRRTSVHEIGHTLISRKAQDGLEFHKVSILPRGRALGVTMSLPTEDKLNLTESECKARIRVLLGGRAAEILIFKECSTGASDDLERATELAKDMVTRWGMSDHGPVAFERGRGPMFLGRDLVEQRSTSETTAREFELTIMKLLGDLHKEVMQELTGQRDDLERLAEVLLTAETLTRDEIDGLLAGT